MSLNLYPHKVASGVDRMDCGNVQIFKKYDEMKKNTYERKKELRGGGEGWKEWRTLGRKKNLGKTLKRTNNVI